VFAEFRSSAKHRAGDRRSNVEIIKQNTERKDSIIYWLAQKPTSTTQFYYTINDENEDTLVPYLKNQPKEDALEKLLITTNMSSGNHLLPNENLIIKVNHPVLNVDDSRFHFLDKDSNVVEIDYHFENVNELLFHTHSKAMYLQIDSLAIESVFGVFNHNKPKFTFVNLISDEYFGQLFVKFDSLESSSIFELLDSKQKVIKTYTATLNETELNFKNLKPGKYHLRVITDSNQDGKWTKGSISLNKQSENVFYFKDEIKIRSKWDFEIEVKFGPNK
jgi:hypothetical protein